VFYEYQKENPTNWYFLFSRMCPLVFFENLVDNSLEHPELFQYPDSEKIFVNPGDSILIVLDTIVFPTIEWKSRWKCTHLNYLCYLVKNHSSTSFIIEQGCCVREIIDKPYIQYWKGFISTDNIKNGI
jgi:hypothetical protein